MWLFDEILKKYSYVVYIHNKDKCFDGLYIDIKVKPKWRIEPLDEYEMNDVWIKKENVIKVLKPLVEEHIKNSLKKFYPKI